MWALYGSPAERQVGEFVVVGHCGGDARWNSQHRRDQARKRAMLCCKRLPLRQADLLERRPMAAATWVKRRSLPPACSCDPPKGSVPVRAHAPVWVRMCVRARIRVHACLCERGDRFAQGSRMDEAERAYNRTRGTGERLGRRTQALPPTRAPEAEVRPQEMPMPPAMPRQRYASASAAAFPSAAAARRSAVPPESPTGVMTLAMARRGRCPAGLRLAQRRRPCGLGRRVEVQEAQPALG